MSSPPVGSAESMKDSEIVKKAIQIHQSALEDLVNVNSIFTSAVFLGLTFTGQDQSGLVLQKNPSCKLADVSYYARRLVVYEVVSFAFFLMSSLVAKSLKVHLDTHLLENWSKKHEGSLMNKMLRGFLLFLTVWGSIFGCIFLLLSMVNIVKIRLGKLFCHDSNTLHATGVLIAINSLALLIYIPFMTHAIYASMTYIEERI